MTDTKSIRKRLEYSIYKRKMDTYASLGLWGTCPQYVVYISSQPLTIVLHILRAKTHRYWNRILIKHVCMVQLEGNNVL